MHSLKLMSVPRVINLFRIHKSYTITLHKPNTITIHKPNTITIYKSFAMTIDSQQTCKHDVQNTFLKKDASTCLNTKIFEPSFAYQTLQ